MSSKLPTNSDAREIFLWVFLISMSRDLTQHIGPFELRTYILVGLILALNIYTHIQIHKDDIYFLDNEKPKQIIKVWTMPIFGAIQVLSKLHEKRRDIIILTVVLCLLEEMIFYLIEYYA